MPSVIIGGENESSFVEGSQSFVFAIDSTAPGVDEYTDDDDPGFVVHEVQEEFFEKVCKEVAEKYGFPARSIKPEPKGAEGSKEDTDNSNKEDSAEIIRGLQNSHSRSKRAGDTHKNKDEDSAVFDGSKSKEEEKEGKKARKAKKALPPTKLEEKKAKKEEGKAEEKKSEDGIKKLESLIKKVDDK